MDPFELDLPPVSRDVDICCQHCTRKGTIHRRQDGARVVIDHVCPGPFTLTKVEPHAYPAWRLCIRYKDYPCRFQGPTCFVCNQPGRWDKLLRR